MVVVFVRVPISEKSSLGAFRRTMVMVVFREDTICQFYRGKGKRRTPRMTEILNKLTLSYSVLYTVRYVVLMSHKDVKYVIVVTTPVLLPSNVIPCGEVLKPL